MSDEWNGEPGADERGKGEPRLGPRPLARPQTDPTQLAAFGRPTGVDGAFSPQPGGSAGARSAFSELTTAPPPPESLASAFGRPTGNTELLQREPADEAETAGPVDDPADPWRDPSTGAVIGPPALPGESDDDGAKDRKPPAGKRLSLPQLIFGGHVKVTALLVLAVVVLLIGAAGGLVGWLAARGGEALNKDVTLAAVSPGKERAPGSVADIAKRVRPAVVSLEVRAGEVAGSGSGAVIDGDGYILTNDHVVTLGGEATKGQQITAVFNDGTRAVAKIVGTDPKTDLAVVKVEVTNPTVLQLGRSADLAVGDTVVAIGSPLGQQDTVTEGIVSALNRPIVFGGESGTPSAYDAIQTDAAINPGNSGGPLIDSTGALVGINTSIKTTGAGGSIGLGYAIPIDDAGRIADALISDGSVHHADIGVSSASVSAETSDGARVQNVVEGSAAEKAGIKAGDVITKFGDRPTGTAAELIVAVRKHQIGETVPVVLARDGRQLTVQVTLGSD